MDSDDIVFDSVNEVGITREVSARVSLRVIRSSGEWMEMRGVWNELLRNSAYPNVFASWEWQTTWWKWFGEARKLNMLLVEDGQQLLGVAPLYVDKPPRLSLIRRATLRFIGNGGAVCPEYLGLIVRKGFVQPTCAAIAHYLLRENSEWDSLHFEEFAVEDTGTKELADMLAADLVCIVRDTEPRLYTALPASYDDYLASLGGHNRQKKRNRLRQAYSRHNAAFVDLSVDKIESWFSTIADLSTKSRKRQGDRSPFLNVTYAGFHRDLLSTMMPLGFAKVCLLMLDNEPAAFWYLLCYGSKFYAYQTGTDTSRPGSPGDVCLQMAIMLAIDHEGSEIDFLRGRHSYKQAYGRSQRATRTVCAFRRLNSCYLRQMLVEHVVSPTKRSFRALAESLRD